MWLVLAFGGDLSFTPGELLHTRGMKGPASCVRCHPEEAEDWQGSRHQRSWDNPLIQAAFAVEPLDLCVRCHLPLPEQAAEVMANVTFYRSLDPDSDVVVGSVARQPEPLAGHGIHCGTCHVRDGDILAAGPVVYAMHPVREEPQLASPDFCISCHDFPAHHVVNGTTRLTELPMQATGSEWRAWRAAGGEERCQDCHMPDGRHRMQGAHDVDFVRDAVQVDLDDSALILTARGVGHHVPTGDIFRHLTVDARVGGRWVEVDWIGRRLAIEPQPDGSLRQVEVLDTALRPGEPRSVALPEGTDGWRVRLHYASEAEQERGLLAADRLTVVLHDGAW